jgi:hypothetical protein
MKNPPPILYRSTPYCKQYCTRSFTRTPLLIYEEEEWGFLGFDAANAFNELNRMAMLWTIRHEWPSGARFAFNCYRHCATLVIRGKGGTVVLIFSKEGVTQGDPLSMFGYGIGILPLIRKLKLEFPALKQPWYANDAGAGGSFTDLRKNFFGSKN